MQVSSKMSIFQSSQVDKVMALTEAAKAAGRDIISLNMGVPFYPLLPEIATKLAANLTRPDISFYTPFNGRSDLRAKLAEVSSHKTGRKVSPEEISVTVGAMAGLFNVFLTVLDQNDEIIIPAPYFYSYRQQVELVGAKAVEVPLELNSQGAYELPLERIKKAINKHTRAILINSPHNPTGAIFSEQNLRELAALVADKKIYVITDEVYDYLSFTGKEVFNIASLWRDLDPYLIRCYSFSKIYGITGYRLGYLQADKALIDKLYGVNMDTVICAPTIAQELVMIALSEPELPSLAKHIKTLTANRSLMMKELDQSPELFSYIIPQGTYYMWVKYHLPISSYQLTRRLIQKEGVAVFPGTGFGEAGEGFIRFSFGGQAAKVTEAFARLRQSGLK
ncbi:pyridoxal phosphate-dependent aminotransferase [Microgenomates group bacterium]|nr:pyridoxal phosphate-dependent aminotransferase [Microgenomates group bacterium]